MVTARVDNLSENNVERHMPRFTGIVVAAAVVAVFAFATSAQAGIFGSSQPGTPPALRKKLHKPVSSKLVATLKKASQEGLGLGTKPDGAYLKAIAGPHLTTGHKVGLLYIGADFCPYCAAERWGLVLTLLRFGKFNGLRYMLSSSTDVDANTPTVTFQHMKYKSRYVAFQAVEIADRNHHPLTAPDKLQNKIFAKFDAPPYVRYPQAIPFVYVDGQYMLARLMVMPQQLSGMNWQQIADMLANPQTTLFQSVMPRVNLLTAAICRLDGNYPSDVCTAPGIAAANGVLPKPHPATH